MPTRLPSSASGNVLTYGRRQVAGRILAHLKGADVVILPDNDKVGEAHANDVAQSLSGVAARVRVLRLAGLPDGGDVYDWLQAGGNAEQLFQAAEIADEWSKPDKTEVTGWRSHVFTAAALRTMTFPPVSYVVPGIIPEGLTILAGRPKIGKSWMALDLAIGIAPGKPVLGGVHVERGDVLYCCLEDNPRRLKRRVTKLLSPFSAEWPERLTLATKWQRLDQGGVDDIEAWCDGSESRASCCSIRWRAYAPAVAATTLYMRATTRRFATFTDLPMIAA